MTGNYPDNIEEKLGFGHIRRLVGSHLLSPMGERELEKISFATEAGRIREVLHVTEEFMGLLEEGKDLPAGSMIDMTPVLERIAAEGTVMSIEELYDLRRSLETMRAVARFAKGLDGERYPRLREMMGAVRYYPVLLEHIDRVLTPRGTVKDTASPALRRIRAELSARRQGLSARLQGILQQARRAGWVEDDAAPTLRQGRMVIPLPATHKRRIPGIIVDESATGRTVYVEPAEIVEINNDIRSLGFAEEREIERILQELTRQVRPYVPELLASAARLGEIDLVRAKALFGRDLQGSVPAVEERPLVAWHQARHPLLVVNFRKEGRQVVPLDIELNGHQRILVISGPNAGGKSVCLQTVGLLQYMLQCGLPVPVAAGSRFGIFDRIFLDMGDEQSIENDLSTYSSRLLAMKHFLRHAGPATLVLMDELGTGTEPMLGGALAETVLRRLNAKGVYGVVTTHYTNLKHLAASEEGIVNGAMLFDHGNMQPLYRLDIGKPGSSFAFEMARRIGLPEEVLQEAASKVGEEHVLFDKHLKEILRDKRYWESKRRRIRQAEKRLEALLEEYEQEMEALRRRRREILDKAQEEAGRLLSDVNRKIERTIREIREAQAEKERTRTARRELEALKERLQQNPPEEKSLEQHLREVRRHRKKHEPEISAPTLSLRAGSKVRMKGTDTVGEVISVKGDTCLVAFGNLTTHVAAGKLEGVSEEEYRRRQRRSASPAPWQEEMRQRRIHFRPEIDIRGKRVEEALQEVTAFLDEAVMVGEKELRIIHGKGNGILREAIRDFLHAHELVERCHDEHVDRGGAGVTVVVMGE